MADPAQFTTQMYKESGNPYPAVYDFEARNLSCAGTELAFLDDCIAFCNPFGYEAAHEVCDCEEGTQICAGRSHEFLDRPLIPRSTGERVSPTRVEYTAPSVVLNPGTCYVRYTCD